MTRPSASTRSAVRCGRAVCPPGEVSEISTTSHAEVIGPTRVPSLPTSSRGSQCSAKIRSTPSMAPSATMSIAPPGCTSSAGWKIEPDPPRQRRRTRQREPGAEQHRGVRVVAAGVHDVRRRRGERQPRRLVQRESVDVGAQGHAARAAAHVADQTGAAGQGARLEAGRRQQAADQGRGAVLGAAQLRRGVQGTTPGDDLGPVQCQPRVQPCRTAACAHVDDRGTGGRHDGRVLLQDRHRTPPPLDSSWCISSYSSPGRRCSKQIRPTSRNARRGVADLLRTGTRHVMNGRTRDDERGLPPFVAPVPASSSVPTSTTRRARRRPVREQTDRRTPECNAPGPPSHPGRNGPAPRPSAGPEASRPERLATMAPCIRTTSSA